MKKLVIYPESFSLKPNIEATTGFKNLFNTTSQTAVHKTLSLVKGNYVFCSKNADMREIHISNTIAADEYAKNEQENMHKTAIVIENVKDMEIDCCDSNFIMDGVMTNSLIKNCEKIKIKNLNIETVLPNVHKVTVIKASSFYVTVKIDDTSKYAEENGEFYWYGTDYKLGFTEYKNRGWWMATARPSNYNHIKRNESHPFAGATSIKQIADRVFNVRFITPKDYEVGQVFYMFPCVRKEVGIFVDSSKDIVLENVKQRYNNSLAFIAQNSENITLNKVDFSPNPNAEVDFTSVADFMQFSMCRGRIKVLDSNFDSAGDDACNVHGFHFKIVKANKDKITVKFAHPQSYGFECIREGDTIAFVDPKTLLEVGRTKILHATLRDEYYYDLVLATYDPPIGVGGVIENISACPDFEFSGNTINRIVTRGVLVTTRGKVRIENNKFLNTGMSGILISNDASSWYESGCVRDVVIRGNAFMNCDENAILIKPENRRYAGPVHRNILIESNLFIINNTYALNVSNSADIVMRDNVYKGRPADHRWVNAKNTENLITDCPK